MLLIAAQSDRCASRTGRTTNHDGIASCRNFDACAAFARSASLPHKLASTPVSHIPPMVLIDLSLSASDETCALNLCQSKRHLRTECDGCDAYLLKKQQWQPRLSLVRHGQPNPLTPAKLLSDVIEVAELYPGDKLFPFSHRIGVRGTVGLEVLPNMTESPRRTTMTHAPVARARDAPAQVPLG